jgi:hypothetical protein
MSAGRACVSPEKCATRSGSQRTASFSTLPRLPSERCVDLMYIAAGVYAADRLIKCTTRGQSEQSLRIFDLTVAVSDLQLWQQPHVKERIEEIVDFLTDEDWTLTFKAARHKTVRTVVPNAETLPPEGASRLEVRCHSISSPYRRCYPRLGHHVRNRPAIHGSCPGAWCTSRDFWFGWTRAQRTTADSRAG